MNLPTDDQLLTASENIAAPTRASGVTVTLGGWPVTLTSTGGIAGALTEAW